MSFVTTSDSSSTPKSGVGGTDWRPRKKTGNLCVSSIGPDRPEKMCTRPVSRSAPGRQKETHVTTVDFSRRNDPTDNRDKGSGVAVTTRPSRGQTKQVTTERSQVSGSQPPTRDRHEDTSPPRGRKNPYVTRIPGGGVVPSWHSVLSRSQRGRHLPLVLWRIPKHSCLRLSVVPLPPRSGNPSV